MRSDKLPKSSPIDIAALEAQVKAVRDEQAALLAEKERKSVLRKLNWCAPKPFVEKRKPGGQAGVHRGKYKKYEKAPVLLDGANVKEWFSYDERTGYLYAAVTVIEKRFTDASHTATRNVKVKREGKRVGHATRTLNRHNPDYTRFVTTFRGREYDVWQIVCMWMTGGASPTPPEYEDGDMYNLAWANLIW